MRTVENLERPLPLKSSEGVDVAGVLVELVLDRMTFSFFSFFFIIILLLLVLSSMFFFVFLWRAYRDVAPLLDIPEDTGARGGGNRGGEKSRLIFIPCFTGRH